MLFVDFPPEVIARLPAEFGVQAATTLWNDRSAPPIPFEQHSIVFFFASYQDRVSTSLHLTDQQRLANLLERRGLVIYFMTNRCYRFHMTNWLGNLSWLQLTDALNPPQQVQPVPVQPFVQLFSRYGHLISETRGLAQSTTVATLTVAAQHYRPQGLTALAFFVSGATFYPIALEWTQVNGTIIILPSFEPMVLPDIIGFVKEEVMPNRFPHLIEADSDVWLGEARYLMEPVRVLIESRQQLITEHNDRLSRLDEEIRRVREVEQDTFNRLLTATGDPLKHAVMTALQYLGMQATDVDEYWRERAPDRQKEEDLWVSGQPFEPRIDAFRLVEVTSNGRGGASEDDCGRIVRYLLRRRLEFSNNSITGLLVINHQYRTQAHLRRPPFTSTQIGDAVRDGYGLTSTYELFKAIRAEKANQVSKEQIRNQLLTRSGYLEFPEI